MREQIQFDTRVTQVSVKEKTIRHPATKESAEYLEVTKVGKLTLEFDGDDVDVGHLAKFIGDMPVAIGLAETQMSLPGIVKEGA